MVQQVGRLVYLLFANTQISRIERGGYDVKVVTCGSKGRAELTSYTRALQGAFDNPQTVLSDIAIPSAASLRIPSKSIAKMQGFNMGRYVPPEHEGTTSANKLAGKYVHSS